MLQINLLTKLDLGVKDENKARDIPIDMNAWYKDYPNGTFSIWHKRNGDQTKYAASGVSFDRETGILTWTPDAYDTYYIGRGLAEFRVTENDVIKKTKDILTDVEKSFVLPSGETLTSGWQAYLNRIEEDTNTVMQAVGQIGDNVEKSEAWATGKKNGEDVPDTDPTYQNNSKYYAEQASGSATTAGNAKDAAVEAKGKAEDAQAAAEAARDKYPQIDDSTKNWKIWDPEDEQYEVTEYPSRGQQGNPGADSYLYIRYAAAEPTQDSDMKTTPDAWIGMAITHSNTAPAHYTDYIWYKFKGEDGAGGVPAGGTTGQIIIKNSNTDYDASWSDIPHDSTKLDTSKVYNGTDKNTTGYALDAVQGKFLNESVSNIRKGTGKQATLQSGSFKLPSGTDAAIGEYVWVNGQLGKATAALTGGTTVIVEGTNWSKVTEGALNELAGDIAEIENVSTTRDLTILAADWTLSGGVYTYTWTDALVTASCDYIVQIKDGAESSEIDEIETAKVTGGIQFTSAEQPQGSLPVTIKIIKTKNTELLSLDASQVTSDAVSGTNNVEDALLSLSNNLASKVIQINITLPAYNGIESKQIQVNNFGSNVPKAIQIKESGSANPFLVTNWWISSGTTTLTMQVYHLITDGTVERTVPCTFIF